jgi:hypothetical protein
MAHLRDVVNVTREERLITRDKHDLGQINDHSLNKNTQNRDMIARSQIFFRVYGVGEETL